VNLNYETTIKSLVRMTFFRYYSFQDDTIPKYTTVHPVLPLSVKVFPHGFLATGLRMGMKEGEGKPSNPLAEGPKFRRGCFCGSANVVRSHLRPEWGCSAGLAQAALACLDSWAEPKPSARAWPWPGPAWAMAFICKNVCIQSSMYLITGLRTVTVPHAQSKVRT
jgi:hypothetical protein